MTPRASLSERHAPHTAGDLIAAITVFLSIFSCEPSRIAIVLQDQAALPTRTLARAQNVTSQIFAASGIELQWTKTPIEGRHVRLTIVNHRLKSLPKHAVGYATLTPGGTESYAIVSLPAVEEVARSEDVALEIVLGASLAHEIGHVLLRSSAHSPAGVMLPRFTRRELRLAALGRLLFSTQEAERLRAAITAPEN
jgi:hypothetical protein